VPPAGDHAPNPPEGYVVSFIRFHERGFAAPASRFMRALCHRYGVELHNFAPNAISQAATFVGICEGYLGLQGLRDAALETCRSVEEGEAQAGSSLASRLRALGGHVTERMRRVLRLGVQKALGVVRSHYEVNFEALAEGYVVPDGVEDEVVMERVDALAADAAGTLAEAFEEFLFPDAVDAAAPHA
jgi:hypothetical protein